MLRAFFSFLFLLGTTVAVQAQPDDIIRIANGVLDSTQHSTLGLTPAPGTETITIFHPTDSDDHYANGVVLTVFKDALYCMWQSSAQDEDSPDTWVACNRSCDNGKTWTRPQPLALANDTAYCTSGGWITSGNTLVAFVNVWPRHLSPTGGYTYYSTSTDGTTWSALQPVTMADGSPMNGVIEQDPITLSSGRIVGAAHFQPGLHVCPIYTDHPLGTGCWHKGIMPTEDRGNQSRELEPSLYQRRDGTLVMIFRDQQSTFRKRVSVSRDGGLSWTQPTTTNIPDARVKQSTGQLPDGTIFLAANPVGAKRRYPLALLLSSDGIVFDRAYLLRAHSDLSPQRYPGKAKTLGYNYPKSFVHNGYIYVAYSENKEDVVFTRVPIDQVSITNRSQKP
jgi:hypothetical protein